MIKLSSEKRLISSNEIRKFIDEYLRPDANKHADEGNWHNVDKPSGNLGYGWIHYSFIRNVKPKRVLVIGSRYGFIPAVCALACRENKKGKVDFVDAGYDQDNPMHKNHWGGVGFWTKADVNKHFAEFNLEKYLKTHIETSLEFFEKKPHSQYGYIYIDGDHTYDGVKSDFEHSWSLLEQGGMMSLHDIHIQKIGDLTLGVHKLWRELKYSKKYNMIDISGEFGLGLIQK